MNKIDDTQFDQLLNNIMKARCHRLTCSKSC